jgi:acyl dehydratase
VTETRTAHGVTQAEAMTGRILDEDISRAKQQVGIPTPLRHRPWNPVPDPTSISHYAFGCGDDNPLWSDPGYAASTRWGGVVAPPTFATTTGVNVVPAFPEGSRERELFRGLFKGVGKYLSGVTWEFYQPMRPGVPVLTEGRTTEAVDVKQSSFSGGASVLEHYRQLYVAQDGSPFAAQRTLFISAERKGAKETGKYQGRTRHNYTPDEIARIDESYATEERRGAEPRLFGEVRVGDSVGHVTKGPLTVLDVIAWHGGYGLGHYGIGPLRLAWQMRQKMPAFYVLDEFGVPDTAQRLHWDPQWAGALGLPAPYDYGEMRAAWMSHLVTNWMGDNAWMSRLSVRLRGFNFLGDTQFCSGEIVDKRIEGGRHVVDLSISAVNQLGVVTTTALATVVLPASPTDDIVLPDAPDDVARRAREMAMTPSGVGAAP